VEDNLEELRTRADVCYEKARSTTIPADKVRWLRMAQFWLEMAMQYELKRLRQAGCGAK
jgi:hypothetical protein